MIYETTISNVRRYGFLCSAAFLCAACAPSNCPALHQWTDKEQDELADEIGQLPDDSLLIAAMEDYDMLRKACR